MRGRAQSSGSDTSRSEHFSTPSRGPSQEIVSRPSKRLATGTIDFLIVKRVRPEADKSLAQDGGSSVGEQSFPIHCKTPDMNNDDVTAAGNQNDNEGKGDGSHGDDQIEIVELAPKIIECVELDDGEVSDDSLAAQQPIQGEILVTDSLGYSSLEVAELREKLKAATVRMKKLQSTVDSLNLKLTVYEDEEEAAIDWDDRTQKQRLADLKRMAGSMTSQIDAKWSVKVDSLHKANADRVEALRNELAEVKRRHKHSFREKHVMYQAKLDELKAKQNSQMAALHKEMRKVKDKHVEEMRALKEDVREQKSECQQKVKEAKTEQREETKKLKPEHSSMIRDLKERLAKSTERRSELERQIAELQDDVKRRIQRANGFLEKLGDAELKLGTTRHENERMTEKLQRQSSAILELRAKDKAYLDNRQMLLAQMDDFKYEIVRLQRHIQQLERNGRETNSSTDASGTNCMVID